MSDESTWGVLHLFVSREPPTVVGETVHSRPAADRVEAALKECEAAGQQVVTVAMLGHKAELGLLVVGPDVAPQVRLQAALRQAGCRIDYSYVSRTEVSEYAAGVPEAMRQARLHPVLPPEGLPAFCFYPMSKRRLQADNWYRLAYEDRLALMLEHGRSGREFRGRVLQLVTGSTGLDDWEWGVTLFGRGPDDLKECVYQMRFDEASARYAEFGPFLTGTVGTRDGVLAAIGWH